MRRARRAMRRICFAAAAACALLSVTLPAVGQEPPVGAPAVWRGAASSLVASVEADREALLPVPDVLRFGAVTGESVYDTDLQTARASLLYPGEGLLQGPNLACGTFGREAPPEFAPIVETCLTYDYPLTVRADGSQPDRSTQGRIQLGAPTDAVSGLALGANAHAGPDGANTHAALEDLRVLGLPGIDVVRLLPVEELELDASVAAVGSATSRTDQRIADGTLVVEASATLSDVRLVGGLVRIGGIRSSSRVSDDAQGTRTSQADLELTGVTVGGLPAQITEEGLVIGAPAGGLGPLQEQLRAALQHLVEAMGLRITLLETEETTDDGTGQAVASAGGVLVELALNAEGLPSIPGPLGDIDLNGTYVGSVQLGATGAAGAAFGIPSDDVGGGDLGLGGSTPDLGGGFDVGTAPPGLGTPVGAPAARPPAAGSADRPASLLSDPFDGRLELLYAAFALAVLALCVSPRLTVPARLPGPRP